MKHVKDFKEFLIENFALYPTYNNMLGSDAIRNTPITHQVNMSVYGKENVVSGHGQPEAAAAMEGAETKYACANCGCEIGANDVDQNPAKECPECSCTDFKPIQTN